MAATLYLDLASPYAYLAAQRISSVIGEGTEFRPVLLGAIFEYRGWGSWAATDRRAAGMAEVEARARRYGLPPMVWPENWPCNSLSANRAAIWAKQLGSADPFIHALFRREFAHGADIGDPDVVTSAGEEVGLDRRELLGAIQAPDIKESLRRHTDEAWALGVRGVPTTRIGETLFYGDDKLEAAAEHLAAARNR